MNIKDRISAVTQNGEEGVSIDIHKKSKFAKRMKEEVTPTFREVHESLELLKNKFPHRNTDKIIEVLFSECVHKKNNTNSEDDQDYNQLSESRASHNSTVRYFTSELPQYRANNLNKQELQIYNQKKIVAKAFCNRGYGIYYVNQELKAIGSDLIIERNKYKSLISAVALQGYRRLEKFLFEQCQRNIEPLNREQMRAIHNNLLNCRKYFSPQECSIFYKFIKVVFNVQSVSISEEQSVKVYLSIQKCLKRRIQEMKLDRIYDTARPNREFTIKKCFQTERFELSRVWTNDLEFEMIEVYKKTQVFLKIRDYFKNKYTKMAELFTLDSLRSRFFKLMRIAVRKVSCFCQKFGKEKVSSLRKMDDLRIKYLLRSPDGLHARLLLVDIYMNDECDLRTLKETVSSINNFVDMKETERNGQFFEAKPYSICDKDEKTLGETIDPSVKTRAIPFDCRSESVMSKEQWHGHNNKVTDIEQKLMDEMKKLMADSLPE